MTPEEERIETLAMQFARANKKTIARRWTDRTKFVSEDEPVSVFMAGSPGAGKTEASIELLRKVDGVPIIRIDPDELREELPGYTGDNAWLFQKAASILVDRIHDLVLQQKQSFILDGTLSNYTKAQQNINRSIAKGRMVQILYVYQAPMLAWDFVQAREASEGRRILPQTFVEQYFAAREVVNRLKAEYGKKIRLDLLMKNNDNSDRFYRNGVDRIDNHIPEQITRLGLEQCLGLA